MSETPATEALTAHAIIEMLNMRPLEFEGGYFAETHRSGELPRHLVPWQPPDDRSITTAIYYLLTPDTMSAMHLLPGPEVFHHYLGDPVQQLHLFPDGSGQMVTIGSDLLAGQRPQVIVPGGVWQGALLGDGPHGFALMGTTMGPGFDFRDFVPGQLAELSARYPDWTGEISARLQPKT
ncbi:MAG: cupin domain-containing protein [Thermomicrobiales bacterium]